MPRSFDFSAESPASVDEVLAAFCDENYWRARVAAFGAGHPAATLDSLIVDLDGTVKVATTLSLLRDRLPALVNQLGRRDLEMVHTEKWSRIGGSQVRGDLRVAVPGTPVSAAGAALLAPLHSGSRLTYTSTVKVKVRLIGGAIESFMSGRLAEGIVDIQRFTTAWIAENR
jgi:Protein of unknown function (DUF2505)